MKIVKLLCMVFCCSAVFAQERRYEVQVDPNSNLSGTREIQMRERNNSNSSQSFKGEIDEYGTVRMKNRNGDRLRGEIDSYGYGRLRDQDGNVYRVKP